MAVDHQASKAKESACFCPDTQLVLSEPAEDAFAYVTIALSHFPSTYIYELSLFFTTFRFIGLPYLISMRVDMFGRVR